MQHKQMTLAAAIAAALMMMNTAQADTWEITQGAVITTDTTVTQNDSTAGAKQAINAINSSTDTVKGTQTVSMGTSTLTLEQTGATEAATQAANYLNAANVATTAGTTFTQSQAGSGAVSLDQSDNANLQGGNRQAVNMVDGDGTVDALTQQVDTGTSVTLNQETKHDNLQAINHIEAGEVKGSVSQEAKPASISLSQKGTGGANGQIQAVNNIKTSKLTKAKQETAPSVGLSLVQDSTGPNTQAANRADGGATNAVGDLTQVVTFGAGANTITQDNNGVQTQALNMAITDKGVNGTDGIDQSVDNSAADILLKQGATTPVGDGSRQAGNYLKSKGAVSKVSQTLGKASSAKAIELQQSSTIGSTKTVQAGNLIDLSTANSGLTDGSQTITADGAATGELNLGQANTGKVLQAGNAVVTDGLGTGGKLSQTGTLTKLTMLQDAATGSFQATNYLGQEIQ